MQAKGSKGTRALMVAEAKVAREAIYGEMAAMMASGTIDAERWAELGEQALYYAKLLERLGDESVLAVVG